MNIGNLYTPDAEISYQRERLNGTAWEGTTVISLSGKLSELSQTVVPLFSRHPFCSGGEENRYKDEIRREPLNINEGQIPVATVSKTYLLIQHRDVLSSISHALRMLHLESADINSSLLMSEYGERMLWSCQLPNFGFDPGDGFPIVLRMNCLNSVDMSTSLEVTLEWFRLVCLNGMMFGLGDSRMRKRHIRSLDPTDVVSYLKKQLSKVREEQSRYLEWFEQGVTLEQSAKWVDATVSKKWGTHVAARAWQVISSGHDGEVQQTREKLSPHQLPVKTTIEVPGAPVPADNLFHVSQALSWIAGTRNSIQERIQFVSQIPALMEPLVESTR